MNDEELVQTVLFIVDDVTRLSLQIEEATKRIGALMLKLDKVQAEMDKRITR